MLARRLSLLTIGAGVVCSGCIQLRAPDKPIEITLNVNIKQEVVVRLEKDAANLIKQNPAVF